MLVILHGAPSAAPSEAVLEEEAVEKITLYNLITILLAAVGIGTGRGRLDDLRAVLGVTDVGIIKGIDIDGETTGMIREMLGAGDGAITEATGVVVAHLELIVGIVLIGQADALDGVVGAIELAEDGEQLVGDELIAYQFALMGLLTFLPFYFFLVSLDINATLSGLGIETHATEGIDGSGGCGFIGSNATNA